MKTNNYENMVSIAIEKSLLKEYKTNVGRTVYLDKDSEFQIKLFNPTTKTIGADVYVNGTYLGSTIVIKPGQLIWLERYLDEAKKFKFDTYLIDGASEAVKEAIKNNGKIEVKFYREHTPVVKYYNDAVYTSSPTYPSTYNWDNWKDYTVTCACGDSYSLSGHCDSLNSVVTASAATATPINCNMSVTTGDSGDTLGFASSATTTCYSASIDLGGEPSYTRSLTPRLRKSTANPNPTETGRIEKGGYSSQRFSDVNIDLESWPFKTESILLLPKSQKPVFKEDLNKIYCPNCGRKLKTKFNFCPFCGEKL